MIPPASTKAFSSRSDSPRARGGRARQRPRCCRILRCCSSSLSTSSCCPTLINISTSHLHTVQSEHATMSRSCHRNPYCLVNPAPNQKRNVASRIGSYNFRFDGNGQGLNFLRVTDKSTEEGLGSMSMRASALTRHRDPVVVGELTRCARFPVMRQWPRVRAELDHRARLRTR